jgi:hypothetical protein
MTSYSLNDLCQFINQQSYQREELAVYLCQSVALVRMALTQCFQEQEESEQHDYLWAVSNLLDSAKTQNETQLTELMTQAKALLDEQAKE